MYVLMYVYVCICTCLYVCEYVIRLQTMECFLRTPVCLELNDL